MATIERPYSATSPPGSSRSNQDDGEESDEEMVEDPAVMGVMSMG